MYINYLCLDKTSTHKSCTEKKTYENLNENHTMHKGKAAARRRTKTQLRVILHQCCKEIFNHHQVKNRKEKEKSVEMFVLKNILETLLSKKVFPFILFYFYFFWHRCFFLFIRII